MSNSLNDTNLLISNRSKQLGNIEFFKGMNSVELTELAGMMKVINFKKNTVIINQGDLSRSLFIVVQGRLKVSALDEDGNQTIFTFISNGDFFGELSLLSDEPRSATVSTVEESTVLSIDHTMFKDFMDSHPTACWPVFNSLANRIRNMDETICLLTTKDVYGRLIDTLYKLAEENSEGVLVTQKLTHQDFAEMVGSSREMISRTFKDLKQDGYISVEQKRITILKKLPTYK